MHENQATETAYPARPLNVNQVGVQKHVRQFAFLNLQHFICDLYLLCIAFLHLHFLCIYETHFFCTFFLQMFYVCFLRSFFFCIACYIFSRFKISKVNPQGADTSVAAVIWCWEHFFVQNSGCNAGWSDHIWVWCSFCYFSVFHFEGNRSVFDTNNL